MATFKKVTEKDFIEIKNGLDKLLKITPYQSTDESIIEQFDIVSLGSKFPVSYYKTGTLLVQGDESHDDFKTAIRFIEHCLEESS